MDRISTIVAAGLLTIATVCLLSFLLSWFVYMLWNGCLVGAIDGVHEVTWLQAWGLSLLAGLLFKDGISSKSKA